MNFPQKPDLVLPLPTPPTDQNPRWFEGCVHLKARDEAGIHDPAAKTTAPFVALRKLCQTDTRRPRAPTKVPKMYTTTIVANRTLPTDSQRRNLGQVAGAIRR